MQTIVNEIQINGEWVSVPKGAVAYKYQDAIEAAKWLYDLAEAQEIAREDPSLIEWVEPWEEQ